MRGFFVGPSVGPHASQGGCGIPASAGAAFAFNRPLAWLGARPAQAGSSRNPKPAATSVLCCPTQSWPGDLRLG